MQSKTFRDVLASYDTCEHQKVFDLHGDKKVIERFDQREYPFPKASFKNITYWWLLEDGTAIGLNENPNTGASFPVVGHRGVRIFYSSNRDAKRPKEIQL